ncbi:MAG: hypothetical protein JOZ39_01440, partial [Chloroflexi bacterium]|nr:hypothetical protein [Chloroflexota bacterium]
MAGFAFWCLPADRTSWAPGLPWDVRIAAPVLVALLLGACFGRPRGYLTAGMVGLVAFKLLLWPLTIQHGLVGSYYATPDFSGPVEQVRLDAAIDFADDSFPLPFFNDLRFNFIGHPDRNQLPFSVRWTGVIEGGQIAVASDQQASASAASVSFSKGWGPHAYVRLDGASALYPKVYSAGQIAVGRVAAVVQDALAALFGAVLLLGLAGIRFGRRQAAPWLTLCLLAMLGQGYARSWSLAGHFPMLGAGQDWLTYESEARDILAHGWLMNGGAPLFSGQPFFQQSFYAYFVALAHVFTGWGLEGVVLLQFALLGAAAVFMFLLAKELFGSAVASVCLTLFLIFEQVYMVDYASLLLGETLAYALVAGGLFLFARQGRTKSGLDVAGCAVLLGLASNTRSTVFPLGLLVLLAIGWQRRWLAAGLFVGLFAMVSAFIILRNYLVSGQIALLPAYGPVNIAIAHPPPGDLVFTVPPGADPRLWPVWEFLRQRPFEFLQQTFDQLLLVLSLPDHWSWAALGAGLGLFLTWPAWVVSFALLRREAFGWRLAPLHLFALVQLASVLTFGLLAYGLRLALLAYLPLFVFAAVVALNLARRPAVAIGVALAAFAAVSLARLPAAGASNGAATVINPDLRVAARNFSGSLQPGGTGVLDL